MSFMDYILWDIAYGNWSIFFREANMEADVSSVEDDT